MANELLVTSAHGDTQTQEYSGTQTSINPALADVINNLPNRFEQLGVPTPLIKSMTDKLNGYLTQSDTFRPSFIASTH